jgi:hypothetical protein
MEYIEYKVVKGAGEYIHYAKCGNKYVKYYDTDMEYYTKKALIPNYEDIIKELLIKKLNEL